MFSSLCYQVITTNPTWANTTKTFQSKDFIQRLCLVPHTAWAEMCGTKYLDEEVLNMYNLQSALPAYSLPGEI